MSFPQSNFLQISFPLQPSAMDHGAVEYSLRYTSSNRVRMNHTPRTMTEENLALALESAGIRARIGLTHFKVGFHIDVRTFLQITEVIVRVRAKGKDVMPGSLGLRTSCQSDVSVPQSYLRVRVMDVLPSGLGGGEGKLVVATV
jgi:hypothetical protein